MQTKFQWASLLAVVSLLAISAHADTVFTVDSVLDEVDVSSADGECLTASGTCTLRAAVMQANPAGDITTIMLPAGVYTLTLAPTGANGADSGDLNFTTPASGNPVIVLAGAGASTTIIDGNALDRVIRIDPGRTVAISDVAIQGGSSDLDGGGIVNQGYLVLSRSVLRDNQAYFGGGLENYVGAAFVANTTIVGNRALSSGGGIDNFRSDLRVIASTISENTAISEVDATAQGGGIWNSDGTQLRIDRSTLSGNVANQGGAIYNEGGPVIVRNSTLSGNAADGCGGAICNVGSFASTGTINIYNSTVIGNEADHDQDLNGVGGGLFNEAGSTLNIRNTLFAGNYRSGAPVYDDCNGTVGVYGNNLFFSLDAIADCTFTGPGEVGGINSAALIGPLQNNGGPTLTHALLPGSNAIDGADPIGGCVDESLNPLSTDQRGFPRVVGVRCDVGAFEYGDTIFLNGFDF